MQTVDHKPVQEAETIGAQRVKEVSEHAISLLFQQRMQQLGNSGHQSGSISPESIQLYRNFYSTYRAHGAEEETAQSAAVDAVIGLDAQSSKAIKQAEAQALRSVQAEPTTFDKVAPIRTSNPSPEAQPDKNHQNKRPVQIANSSSKESTVVEQPVIKAKTAATVFKEAYQQSFEQRGVNPQTAKAASNDVINGKGERDSFPIQQAHQEVLKHEILKEMYQSVYTKSGVPDKLATQAADQMARGYGARRSPVVQRAHHQALSSIKQSQNKATSQSVNTARINQHSTNHRQTASAPSPHIQPKKAASPEQSPEKTTVVRAESSNRKNSEELLNTKSSEDLWSEYSPDNDGQKLRQDVNYEENPRLNDVHFAYNALSHGETVEAVKAAILQNSSEANAVSDGSFYTDKVIERAQQEISSSNQTVVQAIDDISIPETNTSHQPVKEASATGNFSTPDDSTAIANTQGKAPHVEQSAQTDSAQLTAQALYSLYSEANSTGVAAVVSKNKAKANDLMTAQNALLAGYTPHEVKKAIASQSAYGQTLKEPKAYGQRIIDKALKTSEFEQKAPEIIWAKYHSKTGKDTVTDKDIVSQAIRSGYKPKHVIRAVENNSGQAKQEASPAAYANQVVTEITQTLGKQSLRPTQQKTQAPSKTTSNLPSRQKKVKAKSQGIEM